MTLLQVRRCSQSTEGRANVRGRQGRLFAELVRDWKSIHIDGVSTSVSEGQQNGLAIPSAGIQQIGLVIQMRISGTGHCNR